MANSPKGEGMKRIMGTLLVLGLMYGGNTAEAVDFGIKGEFLFGAGVLNSALVVKRDGKRPESTAGDKFTAMQRLRLQMDAVASEALSGTVCLEVGDNLWGSAEAYGGGAALGTDGKVIKVRHAYMDWQLPNTNLHLRMGLQTVALPHAAGGSSVMNNEMGAVIANYRISDSVGITAGWMRVFNDNYPYDAYAGQTGDSPQNYLDNLDLFSLAVPLVGRGWQVTPWAMTGMLGENTYMGGSGQFNVKNTIMYQNIPPYSYLRAEANGTLGAQTHDRQYGMLFFAGLPVIITAFEPLRVEADFNYGYSQGLGRYEITDLRDRVVRRASDRREGWLAKALVEYKMDWGTPGLLGWYASGDDGNVKNGSERMPAISPCATFTSFVGDDPTGFGLLMSGGHTSYDLQLNYAGTWGIGVQIKDVSFVEDLSHALRVVRWGGTNSPSMVKYLMAGDAGENRMSYLTTQDAMLEFNLDSVYQFSENLSAHIQLGYVVNQTDTDTWRRGYNGGSLQKGDAYKASAMLYYKF